jgi:hypothetical protein
MRATELLAVIEDFLRGARRPALAEPGERVIDLEPGQFEASATSGGIRLHVWSDTANLTRKIVGVREARAGRLELEIERFGKQRGTWLLVDRARASNHAVGERSERRVFAERFRAFLGRQFVGWEIAQLSAAGDLQHSLSPSYPRALVTQGAKAWAAIAAPPGPNVDGALTFGLVWMDYLRRRVAKRRLVGLAIFVPAGAETVTCLRMRHLNPNALQPAVFTYDHNYVEQPVDIRQGNLVTLLDRVPDRYGEFRRMDTPEGRLEARIRMDVTAIDGRLMREPVYGQVPAFAGRDRGVMDLLAADAEGRLAVIELKASEDIHLPLQALDYWMRVAWHAERRDFELQGYFPGRVLSNAPPRLLLVSPALHFHPATEAVLRFFAPTIDVERVGIQSRTEPVSVTFRLHGWREPWHASGERAPGAADGENTDRRNSQVHSTVESE